MRFDEHDVLHVRRSAHLCRSAACLRGRASVPQRRRARFPGLWQLGLYAGYMFCWSQVQRRAFMNMVIDAVRTSYGRVG